MESKLIKSGTFIAAFTTASMFSQSHANELDVELPSRKIPIRISAENAYQYGVDYESLRQLFNEYRQTEQNEIFWMNPHEENGFFNFSSFDGHSISTTFEFTPVEPNALGGGNK